MIRAPFFRSIFFAVLVSMLIASCASSVTPPPNAQSEPIATIEQPTKTIPTDQATPLPTSEPTPTVELSDDVIIYDIVGELDRSTMILSAEETIRYTNGRLQPIDHLLISVQPNTYPNGAVINSLQINSADHEFTLDGQELLIPSVPLAYGEMVDINISFAINIPYATQGDPTIVRPQIYGYTDRQINLLDWYPMITARDSLGEPLLHPLGYYGENLVYPLSSGSIALKLVNFDPIPISAASGAVSISEDMLSYQFSDFRDFTITLSNSMNYVEGEAEGVTLRSYFFPGYEAGGQAVLDATRDAVRLYTRVFGPIDNSMITAVQGDFEDGMEYEGLYYLSNSFYNLYDGEADQYLVMVAAHETCHQWFFGSVANDQATEPWLDESLATYCEKLFYETYYPRYLDWWHAVRIDFYQPQGKIDEDIYSYRGFDPYTNAVYRRGAMYYDDLRNTIGDEAFFAFLKDYYTSLNGKIATAEDHFRILREHTNADITVLIEEYFSLPR